MNPSWRATTATTAAHRPRTLPLDLRRARRGPPRSLTAAELGAGARLDADPLGIPWLLVAVAVQHRRLRLSACPLHVDQIPELLVESLLAAAPPAHPLLVTHA